MNVWFQLHRLPVYRSQWRSVFTLMAVVLGFASTTYAQRLTPPPFEFPPSFSAPLPAQVPNLAAGRTQTRTKVKTVLRRKPPTKAQLNQALIAEAYRRNTANVTKLLAQGADPNARDKAGVPALFYAAAVKDNALVVMLLLNKRASVNTQDPHGNTPLAEAVQFGDDLLAKLLLDRKADPNARNGAGFTPLGIAAAKRRDNQHLRPQRQGCHGQRQRHGHLRPRRQRDDGEVPAAITQTGLEF